MANRDSFNFKSTFKEKKVMKKSIVIFVVFCFCFWSGFLLAQNPDPTHIIGNPGDDEIVLYPTGVYNSGTKAMCAVTLPPLIASDKLTVYDGTNAPVTFTFVDADNGPYDLEIPIGPASWRLIGIYCFRNGIKVIPMGPWTFVHAEFGETGINGVACTGFSIHVMIEFHLYSSIQDGGSDGTDPKRYTLEGARFHDCGCPAMRYNLSIQKSACTSGYLHPGD